MNPGIKTAIERSVFVLSFVAFGVVLYLFIRDIGLEPFTGWTAYVVIGLSSLLFCSSIGFSSLAWIILVRNCSLAPVPAFPLVVTVFLVQIGKYAPGNFAHLLGRVYLAGKLGLSKSLVLFTMLVEALWVVAIAAFLGFVTIALYGAADWNKIRQIPEVWMLGTLIALAIIAPVALHKVFERILLWLTRRRHIETSSFRAPTAGAVALAVPLKLIGFFITAVVIELLAIWVFQADYVSLFLVTGIFAVAWVVGFITPGAPAGLGIRELILVSALTPLFGGEAAIGTSALLRLVTILGDGLAFLIGLALNGMLDQKVPLARA